jgi:hypothetical protein
MIHFAPMRLFIFLIREPTATTQRNAEITQRTPRHAEKATAGPWCSVRMKSSSNPQNRAIGKFSIIVASGFQLVSFREN